MDKPSQILPVTSLSHAPLMPPQIPDPSLRGASFDQLLQNRGIRFVHKRGLACPNIESLTSNAHNPMCTVCDGSGIWYYGEKTITGVFYSNSLEKMFEHHGVWEVGSAIVTMPTEYDDGTEADFNTFDQLYIPDFTVRLWELKEYEPTANKKQYLRYPIQKIDVAISVQNDIVKEYKEGIDFNLVSGQIEWIVGKEPSYNHALGRGDVIGIAYYAYPVYTVLQHMRELRVTQEMVNGQKIARRLPQQILVRRDFLVNYPETENKAP